MREEQAAALLAAVGGGPPDPMQRWAYVREADDPSAAYRDWLRDEAAMSLLGQSRHLEAIVDEVGEVLSRTRATALRRRARQAASDLTVITTDQTLEPVALAECAADAPDVPIPAGYVVTADGVWRIHDDEQRLVARAPIAVDRVYHDHETGASMVRVGWPVAGRWVSRVVPRRAVAETRLLVALADYGAPVTGPTAGAVVSYLADQETMLPGAVASATGRCGWHGRTYQRGMTSHGDALAMVPEDEVLSTIQAIDEAGTWEGWRHAVEDVAHVRHAMLAVYTAVASCLMRPCRVDVGYIVSMVGPRQRGKTSAARLAASVWGRPSESSGIIASWQASTYGIEQLAAAMSGLGLVLDDTSRAQRVDVGSTVYMLANGSGRQRGGSARRRWSLVTLSTGEAPLRSYGGLEGAASRTVEVTGDPMPDASTAVRLEAQVQDHYGHLGARVVDYVREADWDVLAHDYRSLRDTLHAEHRGLERAGNALALLMMAARVAETVGLPAARCDVWRWLWDQCERHAAESSQAAAAWSVYQARRAAEVASGRWPVSDPTPWATVAGWLTQAGYPPDAMAAEWRERGWVQVRSDSDTRLVRRSVQGVRQTVVVPAVVDD